MEFFTVNPQNESFSIRSLAKYQLVALCMLLGFAAYMIWDQLYWWKNRDDYIFGFLVPFFVIYVLYERLPVIGNYLSGKTDSPIQNSSLMTRLLEWVAFAGFLVGICLFAIGALLRSVTGPQNPASLAISAGFSGLFISTVFIMAKERVDGSAMPICDRLALTGLFLFPGLVWLISAPLVSVIETKISVFLLSKVTFVVFNLFDILGYELEREGNVLVLPKGRVEVARACSGIYSLTACIFVGTFLAAVFLDRFWKKVLLVLSSMVLAVLTNLFRSTFLTFWAYNYGAGAIEDNWSLPLIGEIGTVHGVMGYTVLGITSLGLIMLLPVFNFKLEGFDDPDEAK